GGCQGTAIMGISPNPWISRPDSLLIEGENGPCTCDAPRCLSHSSAVHVKAATTSSSSMASRHPNCARDAPRGAQASSYSWAKTRPASLPFLWASQNRDWTRLKCGLSLGENNPKRSTSSGGANPC